jgi:protein TonB
VLDIIFENRNKAYGAYDLRKYYDQRMTKAVGLMLCFAALISALGFLPKKPVEPAPRYIPVTMMGHPKEKEKIPEVKPKVKVVVPASATLPPVLRVPVIVNKIDSTIRPIDINVNASTANTNTLPGNSMSSTITPISITTPVTPEPVKPLINKNTPVETADVMPTYPGGWDALKKFLERNLRNPRDMEEGETVSVKVRFVVGYDGKLQSFVNVQDGGDEFNKEVIRVLKKMPDWIPGQAKGENVSVYYTIPVKFVPAE